MVHGYIAYTVLGLQALPLAFSALVIVVVVSHSAHEMTRFTWAHGLVDRIYRGGKTEEARHPATQSALSYSLRLLLGSLAVIIVLYTLISVYSQAADAGRQFAQSRHDALMSKREVANVVVGEKYEISAHVISCSDQVCAFLVVDEVVVLPRERITEMKWKVEQP